MENTGTALEWDANSLVEKLSKAIAEFSAQLGSSKIGTLTQVSGGTG